MLSTEEKNEARRHITALKKLFPTLSVAGEYLCNQGFIQPKKGQDNYFRLRQISAYIYRLRQETGTTWLITYIAEPETGLKITKCDRGEARGSRPLRVYEELGA